MLKREIALQFVDSKFHFEGGKGNRIVRLQETTMRRGWPATAPSTLLFLFLSFAATVVAFAPPRTLLNKLSQGKSLTNQELWFNQTLDHFSPYVIPFLPLSLSEWKLELLINFACSTYMHIVVVITNP